MTQGQQDLAPNVSSGPFHGFEALLAIPTDDGPAPLIRKRAFIESKALNSLRDIKSSAEIQLMEQKNLIQREISADFPSLSHQYRSSTSLQDRLSSTLTTLSTLESSLNETSSLTTPLLNLLSNKSQSTASKSLSSTRVRALKILKQRVKTIKGLHERVLQGHGAQLDLLSDLRKEIQVKGKGSTQGEDGDDLKQALRNSKSWRAMNTRASQIHSHLQTLATQTFWNTFDFVSENEGRTKLSIRRSGLTVGNKDSDPSTQYTISQILLALHHLDLLPALLTKLRSKLVSELVHPLLSSELAARREQSGISGKEGKRQKINVNNKMGSELSEFWLSDSLLGSERSDEGVFDCLTRLFTGLKEILLPSFSSSMEQNGFSESRSTLEMFWNDFMNETLKDIMDSYLSPMMPSTPQDLPIWTRQIQRAVIFERHLSSFADSLGIHHGEQSDGSRFGVLEEFHKQKAADLWVSERKKEWYIKVRTVVHGGWRGWDAVQVKRERPNLPATTLAIPTEIEVKPKLVEPVPVKAKPESPEAEDGWSFNEDWQSMDDGPAEKDAGLPTSNSENDGGWDFDDIETPKVETPVKPKKPIRVAKRIGKSKAKHDVEEEKMDVDTHGSNDQTDGGNQLLPVSSSVSLATSGISSEKDQIEDDWAWGDPEPQAVVPQEPQVPAIPAVIVETCSVSKSCEDVVGIVEEALQMTSELKGIEFDSESFDSLPDRLHQGAIEILDLFRALMPVINQVQIDSVPSLSAQFCNDCDEIARRVNDLEKQFGWNARGVQSRLLILGESILHKQMDTQIESILELLAEADGFENVVQESRFDHYHRIIEQVKDKIQVLHRVWMHVMLESTCLECIGKLVDVAVEQIAVDIIAIQDITADESEKLNKLCQELKSLENLFMANGVTAIASYAPHWLKFCYTSELLEASLADIRYLFETGALVDFTKDELVHLILALFTDTPLRAQVIAQVMGTSVSH